MRALPYCIRVLLESAMRNCDNKAVNEAGRSAPPPPSRVHTPQLCRRRATSARQHPHAQPVATRQQLTAAAAALLVVVASPDVQAILNWGEGATGEVPFKPARVIMQDMSGGPCLMDLEAMRRCVADLVRVSLCLTTRPRACLPSRLAGWLARRCAAPPRVAFCQCAGPALSRPSTFFRTSSGRRVAGFPLAAPAPQRRFCGRP